VVKSTTNSRKGHGGDSGETERQPIYEHQLIAQMRIELALDSLTIFPFKMTLCKMPLYVIGDLINLFLFNFNL
jgi:hypothetical protein